MSNYEERRRPTDGAGPALLRPTFGISYAPCDGMEVMLVLLALMFGAFMTLPVWGYSAKWKLYPCSACFGLATIGALLVVAGVI